MNVGSTRVLAIAHATEDLQKVIGAIETVCPQVDFRPKIEKNVVKGHFGNKIVIVTLTMRGRASESFIAYLFEKFHKADREKLFNELGNHLDEQGRFHVRLDKQECYRGIIRLRDDDPIKIQIFLKGVSESLADVRRFFEYIGTTCQKLAPVA